MSDEFGRTKHTLTLENREVMSVTGIKDVGAFNEEEICASSDCGEIIIKGNSLHVDELNLDTGILKVSGKIGAFVYNDKVAGKGFWGKVFA